MDPCMEVHFKHYSKQVKVSVKMDPLYKPTVYQAPQMTRPTDEKIMTGLLH